MTNLNLAQTLTLATTGTRAQKAEGLARLKLMADKSRSPRWARALKALEEGDTARVAYYAAEGAEAKAAAAKNLAPKAKGSKPKASAPKAKAPASKPKASRPASRTKKPTEAEVLAAAKTAGLDKGSKAKAEAGEALMAAMAAFIAAN